MVEGESGPKILMLDLSGPLTTRAEESRFGLGRHESPTARLREEIDLALEDDEIAALLLRIDSPGGTVIASDIPSTARCAASRRRRSGRWWNS